MAKLVEILARELQEWPRGCVSLTQSAFAREIIEDNDAGSPIGVFASERHTESELYPTVTRAQWEAERARIAREQSLIDSIAGVIVEGEHVPIKISSMASEEQDLADIVCGNRSREDQALWDKVAANNFATRAPSQTRYSALADAFDDADAFMTERAKRMKD